MSILPKAKSKPRVAASKPAIWPAARLRCTSVFPYGENLGAGRIHFARALKYRRAEAAFGGRRPKRKTRKERVFLFGDPAGTRTPDLRLKRALLYQLSYWVICKWAVNFHSPEFKGWQGWLDSNQRMRESKSLALPLGYTPVSKKQEKGRSRCSGPLLRMGWEMGLEPTTLGTTIRCSNQLSYTHHTREHAIEACA